LHDHSVPPLYLVILYLSRLSLLASSPRIALSFSEFPYTPTLYAKFQSLPPFPPPIIRLSSLGLDCFPATSAAMYSPLQQFLPSAANFYLWPLPFGGIPPSMQQGVIQAVACRWTGTVPGSSTRRPICPYNIDPIPILCLHSQTPR